MAVRIVAGRAGSGKSLRCFERIVSDMKRDPLGPPIYWVVPKQATFSTERWLTCRSGLKAFSRCRVVSFDSLATEIISQVGGGKRAMITKKGRLLILGHLLRSQSPELSHFKASSRTPGLASELLTQLDELARHGQTDTLNQAITELSSPEHSGDASRLLRDKLADLNTLSKAYRDFLGPDRFDKDRRMEFVLSQLGTCQRFREASFYIDGFLDLLDFERRMIASLASVAANLEVTFCMPEDSPLLDGKSIHLYPDEDSIFHRTELAHRALRIVLAEKQIPVEVVRLSPKLPTRRQANAEALGLLERAFSGGKAQPVTGSGVTFIEAPDLRSEVDAAAREILKLTRNDYRFRDILLLTRDLGIYERHIVSSFTEHGIAFFTDRRRDAACHPFLRLLRAVLAIAVTGYSTEHVVTLCKTGLMPGCSEELAAQVENWAISRGFRGDAWAAPTPSAPNPQHAELESLRRQLIAQLKPTIDALRTEGGLSVRDACTRLITLFEELKVRENLARWITQATDARDFEAAAEHQQVWSELIGLVEELADLLGDTTVTASDLQTILLSGLSGLDLGITPATVDQVLVGTAERTRVGDAKVVILLGLSDGIFPVHHADDRLLSDRDRRQLKSLNVSLDDDGSQRQLDERLIAYLAFTRASEKLILCRPTADENAAPLTPSSYWVLAGTICRDAQRIAARPESDATPADISTPRQLAGALLRWARTSKPEADATMTWLYNYFATAAVDESLLDQCRHAVWNALGRRNEVKLSSETAGQLFPFPMVLSDRQIETFAACPYKHFVEYGLSLHEPIAPEFSQREVSSVAHNILDWVCEDMLREAGNWDELPAEKIEQEMRRLTEKATARAIEGLTWDGSSDPNQLTPRDRHLISRVSGMVSKVIDAHRAAAEHTRFVPRKAGVRFAPADPERPKPELPPLEYELASGGKLVLTGKIDRIDASPDGRRVAAWDYNLGGQAPSLPRVYRGLEIRILIHLLVLRDAAAELLGAEGRVEPSGAFVLGIRDAVERYSDLKEFSEAKETASLEYQLARRAAQGLLNREHLSDLDPNLESGQRSSLFPVALTSTGAVHGGSTSALTPTHMERLLAHAEATIKEIAQKIHDGEIPVRPFKLATTSACVSCSYQKICRFDPRNGEGGGQYSFVELTTAKQVLEALVPPAPPPASDEPPKAGKGKRRG